MKHSTSHQRQQISITGDPTRRPEIRVIDKPSEKCAVLVVGLALRAGKTVVLGTDVISDNGLLDDLLAVGATGAKGELVRVATRGSLGPRSVLAVGLGEQSEAADMTPSDEAVREAAGCAARSLSGCQAIATTLTSVAFGPALEGLILGGVAPLTRVTRSDRSPLERIEAITHDRASGDTEESQRIADLTEAVLFARDLVNTPPNELTPAVFAQRVADRAVALGVDVEVLDDNALVDGGFGGIVGVGKGSANPPRLLRLVHRGAPKPCVALVGKGITFDTGGLSIKPAAGMWNLTGDMAGAAAVVSTVLLAAMRQVPLTVVATVPLAENMPSGTALRPGDVLTTYGGQTVHVLNTDAEGRLVLADALARAAQDHPDFVIDVATLTGAQMVALGSRTSGVMGTPSLRRLVSTLSHCVGENAWEMPLPDHLSDDLKSGLADIANVAEHRWAGMLVGGIFLRRFVDPAVPWAHLDIAGPGYNRGEAFGYTPHGGTGVPVRTLFAVLEHIATDAHLPHGG